MIVCVSTGNKGEPGSLSEPGSHQAVAVLGIALIAIGEDIGAEMAHRIYSQLVYTPPLSLSLSHYYNYLLSVTLWGASNKTCCATSISSSLYLSSTTNYS